MMIDLPSYGPTNRIRLGSFLRMRSLVLNYEGSEKLTDFQVKCVLTPSDIPFGKLRADKQDLLFVDNNNELIPYWIEKADSTEIIVWLKFSEIIPGKEVFWLYYGNGNFSGVNNASATFMRIIDGLVASWHFDESSGTIAKDTSGNGNDVTLYGATRIDGKFGKALNLDGIDDYGHRENFSDIPGSYLTTCAWIKTSSSGEEQKIWTINRYPSNYQFEGIFELSTDGHVSFWDYAENVYGFLPGDTSLTQVNDGEWHFVCFVKSTTTGKYYIDGIFDREISANTDVQYGSDHFVIGKDYLNDANFFNGAIDTLYLFNKALSEEGIQDLYNYYGHTTENYPGKVLVKKYAEIEPNIIV